MSTPQFGEPGYTPEQYRAARDTVGGVPVGTGPDPDEMTAKVSGGTPTEVDVQALIRQMQAQQDAMARQIEELRSGQAPSGTHPLIGTASEARALIKTHFEHGGKGSDQQKADIMRLADDLADAAGNAVDSGNTDAARKVAGNLAKALNRVNPGPGDHHYFRQALSFVDYHFGNAADTVTEKQPSNAPALGSDRAPAKVIQGSVTGGESSGRGLFARA